MGIERERENGDREREREIEKEKDLAHQNRTIGIASDFRVD